MNRHFLYYANEGDEPTFANDDKRPSLPLPKLSDSLERYYEALKPFGNADELANSKRILDEFKNGIGNKLQVILEERAKTHKNWIETWWEDYAYLTDRTPTFPYIAMAQPLITESVGIEPTKAYRLKLTARLIHVTMEMWMLLRMEKLKQTTNPDGSTVYSNYLYRRTYNTVRSPGEMMDKIECYFKTAREGDCSSKITILGNGRIFMIDGLDEKGNSLNEKQFLLKLEEIDRLINDQGAVYPVPVLTCDKREKWAKNREHLMELSPRNAEYVKMIDESILVISLDSNSPADWSEISMKSLCGDLHSRWGDKSSAMVTFSNGRVGCFGEHSCYDGSISVSVSTFILLYFIEMPEPNWDEAVQDNGSVTELVFDLDDNLKSQIQEVIAFTNESKKSLLVSTEPFIGYGRKYIKSRGYNPDAYIQMILQVVYYVLHGEFAPTYETALMRKYYNGRTETVRSCTVEAVHWVKTFLNKNESIENKIKALKQATIHHTNLMNAARNGNGFDRHLFGLWCAAFEENIDISKLFEDPLYKKSGGGGNFILSTSTLGYTINNGFVGPMCKNGYGVFYSMTDDAIWTNIAVFRDSDTSARKFIKTFNKIMQEVKELIEGETAPKL